MWAAKASPSNPPAKPVTAYGVLLRAAAVLAGFFAALMLLSDLLDAVTRGPADPIRLLLTCSWGGAVLICAGATWRAAVQRGEG
ncbi:hypothetical protein [Caulobacter vibrioides]|nr:hypothetical protein [Caulobacter vibrioides]